MKKFLAILLSLVMVLSLVACGNKTTSTTPSTTPSTTSTTTNTEDNVSVEPTVTEDVNTEREVETKLTAYISDGEDVSNFTEVVDIPHLRFLVDKEYYDNSTDFMDFFMQSLSYAMASEMSEEELAENTTEDFEMPTEEGILNMLKGNLIMHSSESFVLVNMTTGAMSVVAPQSVNGEGAFDGVDFTTISEDDLKDYLSDAMSSTESMGIDEDSEDAKYNLGEVYKFDDKVIFEVDVTMNMPDMSEIVSLTDTEESEPEYHEVTTYGYGVIVFNGTETFVGMFLTENEDRGTTLMSARSLVIDETVEGMDDEELYSDLFGDTDFEFDSSEFEDSDLEYDENVNVDEAISETVEGSQGSSDFD